MKKARLDIGTKVSGEVFLDVCLNPGKCGLIRGLAAENAKKEGRILFSGRIARVASMTDNFQKGQKYEK